ncbi:MAG: hypothetical protein JW829_00825 [Pirellulales bacterium]|nr:hypothetical protein [Pirellulales bacterium]
MRHITKIILLCAGMCCSWNGLEAQIVIQDTFNRADSTDLGVTEVGGFPYLESGTMGPAEDVAEIYDGELTIYGIDGFFGTGPGVAVIDVQTDEATGLADITEISADMRFEGLFDPFNEGSNNVGGFILRRQGTTPGFTAANEGQVEIVMFPGGGLFVREIHNGALNTLFRDNFFGGSTDNKYSSPGALPASVNGQPFDVDQSGVLEDDEPFRFSASLIGSALDVQVNGLSIASLNVSRSELASTALMSSPVLYKNRYTSAAGLDPANPTFDNLVIQGSPFILAPPRPIIHQGDHDPVEDEGWDAFNGTTPIANNGPVNDDGILAWNINDDSSEAGSREAYKRSLRDEQLAAAAAEGWRLKGSLRVIGESDELDGGIEMSVYTNSNVGYVLWFGADALGNPIVGEYGGLESEGRTVGRTATLGSGGYHNYEMVYDPGTETVDAFADGALIIDDMVPVEYTSQTYNRILWGANSSLGMGNANYKFIEFIIGMQEFAAGDFNQDGHVDATDLQAWQSNFGTTTGATRSQGDADNDGDVDGGDFLIWQSDFGSGNGKVNAMAVPEPAGGMLLLVLASALAVYGQRRLRM